MADAYARISGTVAAVSVHQGCGLTNAMTGIAEAAKSRTPLMVLAAETTQRRSNFYVDQPGLATAVGAHEIRVDSADSCLDDVVAGFVLARDDRRTVLMNLPLEVQAAEVPSRVAAALAELVAPEPVPASAPLDHEVAALADVLRDAQRPVIVAGRGARHARAELLALANGCGALLATSAVTNGLFHDSPWSLGISGGFATPLAAELIRGADAVVGFGCALNMWTTRHGTLIGPDAAVVQVDLDPDAIGRNRPVTLSVIGDSAEVAAATTALLSRDTGSGSQGAGEASIDGALAEPGYRHPTVADRIAQEGRWRQVAHDDWSCGTGDQARIDPRTLSVLLDDALPADRVVAVDSGNFMGYPSAYLQVPDQNGFCFTQAFQSIGLGLATAVGAALAQPDRLPVAALGDGGAMMAAAELDTVRRLGLPMVVVIYNDSAYGAEVHHFTDGEPLDTVTFPETDLAAIGAGYGFDAVTVRHPEDLAAVRDWLAGDRARPLLVDAKGASPRGSWWLEEAFRGH
jgi:acetolactate synthase I/II/III large subunit